MLKLKSVKIITISIFLMLLCIHSAYADAGCVIIGGSYEADELWQEEDINTWITGIYSLEIECTDEQGEPAAGQIAEFLGNVYSNPEEGSPTWLTDIPLRSTVTDSRGRALLNTPLIHSPVTGGNTIHMCRFDDFECLFGSGTGLLSLKNAPGILPGKTENEVGIDNLNCLGELGCCDITVTINGCDPPKVLEFCTNSFEFLCNVLQGTYGGVTIATDWHSEYKCNYCSGQCEDPNMITLALLDTVPGSRSVSVIWETSAEVENAGFNIYRADSQTGSYEKINDALIPGAGTITDGSYCQMLCLGA